MKFLKESFLKFNTYTQIQIGVIGVAFCIFFISVCLLSIISLIVINTTYTEIQGMLELKENDQINGVSIYVDSQINIATELSKIYQFNTRAFINNNLRNTDFIKNFKGEQYKNYIANFDNMDISSKKYVYQRCLVNKPLTEEYQNIQKIFAAYLEVIDYTQNIKYYKNNEERMFKLVSYYSNVNKCIMYFPKIESNQNYNIVNFETFIGTLIFSINNDLDKYIYNYNLNRKKNYIAENLKENPLTFGYLAGYPANLIEFYNNSFSGLINLITLSINFQDQYNNRNITTNPNNYFYNYTNPFESKEIKDYLIFEFSNTMVDKLLIKNLIKFPAFKTIVFNRQLLAKTTCGIMRNIFKFYEKSGTSSNTNSGTGSNTSVASYLLDKECFLFNKEGKKLTFFEDYFYPTKSSSNHLNVDQEISENLRRFVKIPIAYNINYPESIEKAINFKILKFRAADVTTRILINSYFTVWLRPHVYILKNYSFITNKFRIIYWRFLSTELKIISANFIIIIFTAAVVVLLTFRVSKSIGDPISQLISIVKNINLQKDKKKKKNKKKNSSRKTALGLADNKDLKGFSGVEDNHDAEKAEDGENSDEQESENEENEGENDNNKKNENNENEHNENENTHMRSEATVTNTEVVSKEKNLDNIKFPDDETINKFFDICKKLIKGGLTDENLKVKQMQYNDEAYNNISFMKSNNLIVQEDKILKETESRSDRIFSHKSLIEKVKDLNAEKVNYAFNDMNINSNEYLSHVSAADNFSNNNLNLNNFNSSMSLNKIYDPNNKLNIIVNTKNGDEIREIKLERQRTIDKPMKNILGSNKILNSFMSDSPQKPNIFIGGEYAKNKVESVDLYPVFREKKDELKMYFQNMKSVNSINLTYDNINFMMHSNIERKKTEFAENNLFNEESEFDKIVGKHFTKDSLDKVFDFLKIFSN